MKNTSFSFEIVHQSTKSRARVGRIYTAHGVIETPNFVPVATHAALKAVDSLLAESLNLQLVFCNTYHLMLHPGTEVVAQAGGLHSFMQRTKPLITDSGGFQVFSLAYGGVTNELKSKGTSKNAGSVLKISEEGVLFRSYRDGTPLLLTPETSVLAQKNLGADIILPLDELPPFHINPHALKKSMARTHRWEERSLETHLADRRHQAMYGIIHGGIDPELRKHSIDTLARLPFDGFAVGGSFGRDTNDMSSMLEHLMPHVPPEKPVHLLGIGDLPSIHAAIPHGIDTCDSSYPSKAARHGTLFTDQGPLKIMRSCYRTACEPIDPNCLCIVCTKYTKAYLHHLFKAHELSAYTLATIHNFHYLAQVMARYRQQILENAI